jgi:hypothetical protein
MAKYLHVGFNFGSRPIPEEKLAVLFATSLDWVRYAPNCWILWTTTEPEEWYKYIKRDVHKDDTFFICELSITNRQGWLPQKVWDWIYKDRSG